MCTSCFSTQVKPIVGSWLVTSYHDIEYQNGHIVQEYNSAPLDRTTLVFNRDNTMYMSSVGNGFNYSLRCTWAMSGNSLLVRDANNNMECSAIVNGNSMIMRYGVEQRQNGVTYRYVTEMTAKRLNY
jgi:hypothetical protein